MRGRRAAIFAADIVPVLVPTSQTLPPSMRPRTSAITWALSCAYCADSRTLPSIATWLGVSTTATNRLRCTKRSRERTRKLPERLVPIVPLGCRLNRPLPPANKITAARGVVLGFTSARYLIVTPGRTLTSTGGGGRTINSARSGGVNSSASSSPSATAIILASMLRRPPHGGRNARRYRIAGRTQRYKRTRPFAGGDRITMDDAPFRRSRIDVDSLAKEGSSPRDARARLPPSSSWPWARPPPPWWAGRRPRRNSRMRW